MKRLTGLVASQGIAIGKVFPIRDRETFTIPKYSIKTEDIPLEKKRLEIALEDAIKELQDSIEKADEEHKEEAELLNTYLVILQDKEFIKIVDLGLEEKLLNVEEVLDDALNVLANTFASSSRSNMRERAIDIKDAFSGVFSKLINKQEKHNRFENVPNDAIIVARDIMTSEVLAL